MLSSPRRRPPRPKALSRVPFNGEVFGKRACANHKRLNSTARFQEPFGHLCEVERDGLEVSKATLRHQGLEAA